VIESPSRQPDVGVPSTLIRTALASGMPKMILQTVAGPQ